MLKMPAFEWVHVLLRQQKVTMSLSPPAFCNGALLRRTEMLRVHYNIQKVICPPPSELTRSGHMNASNISVFTVQRRRIRLT